MPHGGLGLHGRAGRTVVQHGQQQRAEQQQLGHDIRRHRRRRLDVQLVQSTLALPSGATVLFAGLYWGGDWSTGSAAAPNASARNTVKFRAPGAGAYSAVTASVLDDSTLNVGRYQGFANVTTQVQAAGNGSYTVANVQAGKGDDHYAGWSLVVVYRDTTEPARNLTVFDGLKTIRPSDPPTTIPVSGFTTPPAGAVKTTVGFVTYEGDLGIVGDSASLNTTVLSNAQSPATNFFNSSISDNGAAVTSKTPNFVNQFGYDADLINADGILPTGRRARTSRSRPRAISTCQA